MQVVLPSRLVKICLFLSYGWYGYELSHRQLPHTSIKSLLAVYQVRNATDTSRGMGQTASYTHLGRGAWLADGTGRLGVFPLAARRTALTCLHSARGGRQTMCVEGFLLSVLPQGTMMCQGETGNFQNAVHVETERKGHRIGKWWL